MDASWAQSFQLSSKAAGQDASTGQSVDHCGRLVFSMIDATRQATRWN
jgi:hypothetical protein